MIFLAADFSVIKPDFGLFFWSCIIFITFWLVVGRFAFKPIAQALRKREEDIQSALDEAVRTREEMSRLKAENESLLAEAREERSRMIKEAKESSDNMIREAREHAKHESSRILEQARLEIENQKKMAILEVKNQAGLLALDLAERLIQTELRDRDGQKKLLDKLVNDLHLS